MAATPIPTPALAPAPTLTHTPTQTHPNGTAMPRKVWQHPDPKSTDVEKFRRHINAKFNVNLQTYRELQKWSVDNLAAFWGAIWHYVDIIHEGEYSTVVDETARMDSIPDWFPGVRLNFAENVLLSSNGNAGKEDAKVAITCIREGDTERRSVTWGELRRDVGRFSQALRAHGLRRGDRVCGVVSNSAEALVLMLATCTLGAVYSSSSTDMGTQGILDRIQQIEPAFVFMDDTAVYNRKHTDLRPKMAKIVAGMASVAGFRGMVALPRFRQPVDVSAIPKCQTLATFLAQAPSDALVFERVPFRYPFFIAYSSGTTGTPKCIVHCGGGNVLNARKEQLLNHGVGPTTTFLHYTTTGWIVYLVQIATLLAGAHVIVFDGSPFQPDPRAFIGVMGDLKVTHLGTSPKYLAELQLRGLAPHALADLAHLRLVTSTGMALSPALYDWFYNEGFPAHVQLSNVTGGTDLNSALALGNMLDPVYVGECQCLNLGFAAEVYALVANQPDGRRVKGRPAPAGEPGELVVTKPFPTMPVMFWGEGGAEKYFNSYFAKYEDVWTQGDFAMIHPGTHGLVMLGRADGVLNPSGVRFGSAELYSIIDSQFAFEVADSIAVGQRRPHDLDEHVVLFLMMKPGHAFAASLVRRIKEAIAKGLTKRHVPKYVFETPDIPTTINFKKVELPVKQILCGKKVIPSSTLRNPESLDYYYRFVDVEKRAVEGRARL